MPGWIYKDWVLEKTEEDLITKIAWLYYQEKYTQQDLADYTSLSRQKVQRYLERARDLEIISFRIKHPYFNLLSCESLLIKKYSLKDAVVVPSASGDYQGLLRSFAIAGASYLERLLESGENTILGLGWGNTTSQIADFFNPNPPRGKVEVVSLIGNLMLNVAMNPYIIAQKIADKLEASYYNIWAPAITQTREQADIFYSDSWIRKVLDVASGADILVLSAGDLQKSASLYKMGYLGEEDIKRLKKKGAVGDILSRFIDKEGEVIDDEIHQRVIGIPIEQLKSENKKVIFVSGGPQKYEVVRAVLLGGYADVLITDEDLASRLVEED